MVAKERTFFTSNKNKDKNEEIKKKQSLALEQDLFEKRRLLRLKKQRNKPKPNQENEQKNSLTNKQNINNSSWKLTPDNKMLFTKGDREIFFDIILEDDKLSLIHIVDDAHNTRIYKLRKVSVLSQSKAFQSLRGKWHDPKSAEVIFDFISEKELLYDNDSYDYFLLSNNVIMAKDGFDSKIKFELHENRIISHAYSGSDSGQLTTGGEFISENDADFTLQADRSIIRKIGLALLMYAGEYDGFFPNDLGILLDHGYLGQGKSFVSPNFSTKIPNNGDEINQGKCDYIYLGSGLKDDNDNPTDVPLAFTKPGIIDKGWINVLFIDGHSKKFNIKDQESLPVAITKFLSRSPK